MSIESNDIAVIREYFRWGTRGASGKEPLQYKALKDLTAVHIQAILDTQFHIRGKITEEILQAEQRFRKVNSIEVKES
jgi:hypothetical protein